MKNIWGWGPYLKEIKFFTLKIDENPDFFTKKKLTCPAFSMTSSENIFKISSESSIPSLNLCGLRSLCWRLFFDKLRHRFPLILITIVVFLKKVPQKLKFNHIWRDYASRLMNSCTHALELFFTPRESCREKSAEY